MAVIEKGGRDISAEHAYGARSHAQTHIWNRMARNPESFYETHCLGHGEEELLASYRSQFDGRRYLRIMELLPDLKKELQRPLDILDLGCGLMGMVSQDPLVNRIGMFAPESYDKYQVRGCYRRALGTLLPRPSRYRLAALIVESKMRGTPVLLITFCTVLKTNQI